MQIDSVFYWSPLVYIITINIVSFLGIWWDKKKASQHEWRVAEVTLHLLGIFGGAIGIFCGMYRFHHKTRKRSFQALAVVGLFFSILIYWLLLQLYV